MVITFISLRLKGLCENVNVNVCDKQSIYVYWLDIDDGWHPAVLNSPREHDFIEQKMKECNAEHSCWIGGSTNIDEKNPIHFSQYIHNSTGKKQNIAAINKQ